jgi:hypothetical protein
MMSETSFAAIVASLHARTGKTLLARVLAEYFILSGMRPLLFDTDTAECRLCASFPHETLVVDPSQVPDQMTLFDTMALTTPEARVVDVTHQSFRKVFKVMQDIDFVAEARALQVEPAIFYIADRHADSYAEALQLRARFAGVPFVAVDNPFIGVPSDVIRKSDAYQSFMSHELRLTIPPLDAASLHALADPQFSLSDFMRQPTALGEATLQPDANPLDVRAALRPSLMRMFKDIHRISRIVTSRKEREAAAAAAAEKEKQAATKEQAAQKEKEKGQEPAKEQAKEKAPEPEKKSEPVPGQEQVSEEKQEKEPVGVAQSG